MHPSILLLALLCAARDEPPFREVGAARLPGARTVCGSVEKDWILEVNGGGVLLGDFDGEGSADLVVVDGSTLERVEAGEPGFPPLLYLNDGAGKLSPAGDGWKMEGGRWGMGGATGDADGDGRLDLVVTEWGSDRVFRNRGGEGFEEITERAGLEGERWGTSAAFLDYDLDGALDLAVVNYLAFDTERIEPRSSGACRWKGHAVMCGPEGLTPVHDQLYRGKGDGTFTEVSSEAGFVPLHAGYGLGVTTLDHDEDGDTDLYVTNDSTPNHLWDNQGDGTFEERGRRAGCALNDAGKEQAGMGIAVGDLNLDGREDLFVTNFSGENNAFYESSPRGRFRERSHVLRLGGPSITLLGWGTGMADYDHDGDLDLYVMNGHVYPQASEVGTDTSYPQPDHFFRQTTDGGRTVFELEPLSEAGETVSRASAAADLDADGDLDVVTIELPWTDLETGAERGGAVRVLENRAARGHWLRVRLVDPTSANRSAIGARVTAIGGGARRAAEVRTAGGFQAAVPAEVHFGLGGLERLEALTVRWPDGVLETLEDVAVDRVLEVRRTAPPAEAEEAPAKGASGEGER